MIDPPVEADDALRIATVQDHLYCGVGLRTCSGRASVSPYIVTNNVGARMPSEMCVKSPSGRRTCSRFRTFGRMGSDTAQYVS